MKCGFRDQNKITEKKVIGISNKNATLFSSHDRYNEFLKQISLFYLVK
jgi:hypothetical protein